MLHRRVTLYKLFLNAAASAVTFMTMVVPFQFKTDNKLQLSSVLLGRILRLF